jgi:hypothetical protein
MRSSKIPENLHNFGANNSCRVRTYRRRKHKPFRIRTYKKPGGEGGPITKYAGLTRNGKDKSHCPRQPT